MASTRFNLQPHFIDEETKVWGGRRCHAAQPRGLLPCAAAALEHRGEWGWHHPPQGGVEDNREGQEDHGGSTAGLRNAREGLRGVLVQDRPLWANRTPPQTRTPSVGGQAARSADRSLGIFRTAGIWVNGLLPAVGRRRSGGHSGTQSAWLQAL